MLCSDFARYRNRPGATPQSPSGHPSAPHFPLGPGLGPGLLFAGGLARPVQAGRALPLAQETLVEGRERRLLGDPVPHEVLLDADVAIGRARETVRADRERIEPVESRAQTIDELGDTFRDQGGLEERQAFLAGAEGNPHTRPRGYAAPYVLPESGRLSCAAAAITARRAKKTCSHPFTMARDVYASWLNEGSFIPPM